MNILSTLDLGDLLIIATLLLIIITLARSRKGCPPMAPDTKAFLFEFVKNNTGIAWAMLVILLFLYALLHATKDHADISIIETMKTLLAGAAGWMGNMLTGRTGRAADHTELAPGIAGTQDTVVTTHKETMIIAPTPDPLIVQKIEEPVTIKPAEAPL